MPLPCPKKQDKVVWIPSPSGSFLIVQTLKHLNLHLPSPSWTHLVWFKNSVPKYSFTLWVAIQQKLPILNRRCTSHINATICYLCNSHLESHDHIFFQCDYTKPLWSFIQSRCGIHIHPNSWQYLITWASHHWRNNNGFYSNSVAKLALSSLVYNIWMERNRRIFKKNFLSQNALLQQVLDRIRQKLLSSQLTDSLSSRRIIEEWELPASVIRPPAKPPDSN
ncbi:uncharacterized protein LOC132277803 [Cornus florida]|uniref:uncharacterized protein LOC132277803 n=1 Tax=Cornus florida TaxID=4283 RepID=UPI0028968C72|nr:uncharacterized protein LOC132277803 [Cornus florida]